MGLQPTILLVEDEPLERASLAFMLKREGYLVSTAADAMDALEELKKEQFDIILTDVRMPGMTGIDLLEELQKWDIQSEVVLLTAYGAINDAVRAVKMGAYDYIQKNTRFSDDALRRTLKTALGHLAAKRKIREGIILIHATDLERPIHELRRLLNRNEKDESRYQNLFEKYPWMMGTQYESVQSHRKLDDENIPDFTGVRALDKHRDIIEIKSPFTKVFRRDMKFSAEFNEAWNQVERYLNFAREEKDYLRHKGLWFDNPKCYLLIGYKVPDRILGRIRAKERLNPAIAVLTYDGLIVFVEKTIRFLRDLESKDR